MAELPAGIREHHGRYQVRYYNQNGQRAARHFKRLTDAKKFKKGVDTDRDRHVLVDASAAREPFGARAEKYVTQKLRIRPRTREKYESSLSNYLLPTFGSTPLGAVTKDAVQEWVAGMVRAGLKPETVRGHYALLTAILKRAADDGIIPRTPCRNVELPRVAREEQRFLDEGEVETLAGEHPARYRTIIYCAAYLGPRWQELAGLRRSMLTMRPGRPATMRIVTTIERSHGRYAVVEYGKSAAARRTLKMPEFLAGMLAWHLATFKDAEWVFPAPEGGFLRYDNFRRRVWAPAVEAAGLAPLKFHSLRHIAAAFMISDGADPLQVKRRMGHEDIRTTYGTYGHLFDDREDDLVAALDRRRSTGLERKGDQGGTKGTGEVIRIDRETASEQGF